MADLFNRKPQGFGVVGTEHVSVPALTLEGLYSGDPFSHDFHTPCTSARSLARYLIALQTKRYGKAFEATSPVLEGNAGRLLKEYSVEVVARGICYGVQIANYPFSFKFVREKCIPEILRRCPYLTNSKGLTKQTKTR